MNGDKKLRLLIATRNRGKIAEMRELFGGLAVELTGLDEFPDVAEVEETGSTFEENAVLKARKYSQETGLWALADDSGLEVDALGGKPGVYSSRYAGDMATDEDNIAKLLRSLADTPPEVRSARFRCVMAVCDPQGNVRATADGVCEGTIAQKPRGQNGFGYDPVFVPEGFNETFGELPDGTKRSLSHRARAGVKIIRYLQDVIAI